MSERKNRSRGHRQSTGMAFCGMAAALSVVLMLLGTVIPIGMYAVPLMCGLLLLPIRVEFGKQYAWVTYAVTALLSVLLGMDKETAFFYVFIGWYPLVKWQLDKIRSKPVRILAKLGIFTAAVAAMYALLTLVLHLDAIVAEMKEMGTVLMIAFLAVMDLCLLMYDRLLFPMLLLYEHKLRPLLRIK